MSTRRTRIELTPRGFRQDAASAMRGGIVRGLIELITNSDDAYGDSAGDIHVVIKKAADASSEWVIDVHDSARGLTADEMERSFLLIGEENSHRIEGRKSRGFFGRGAKDVAAFGGAKFAAIRDGKYSELAIDPDGNAVWLAEDTPATAAHRNVLHLAEAENGLTATINISGSKTKIPATALLGIRLGSHAQLRRLVSTRTVSVTDNRGKREQVVIVDPLDPPSSRILDQPIDLSDGFKPIHLIVNRLESKGTGRVDEFSPHGLLITDGRATYENTLFDLDGEPGAQYVSGVIHCEQIVELMEADREAGGASIVTVTRDGLVRQHPLTQALTKAVHEHVRPIMQDIAAETAAPEDSSEELRRDMNTARQAVRDELKQILDEIDQDTGGSDTGGDGQHPLVELIPPRVIMQPGTERTVTARIRHEAQGSAVVSLVDVVPAGAVTAFSGEPLDFAEHGRLPLLVAQIRVRADMEGIAVLRIEAAGSIAECAIEARVAVPLDEEPPAELEFRPPKASVSPSRKRNLRLLAPRGAIDATVNVTVGGIDDCAVASRIELHESATGEWLEGKVPFRAGTSIGLATVTATLDGTETEATCSVKVQEVLLGGGLDYDYTIRSDRGPTERASRRFDSDGKLIIDIWGEDPSVKIVLGTFDAQKKVYSAADSASSRAMLAELITLELATYLTEMAAESISLSAYLKEADRAMRKQREFQTRLVRAFHAALMPR